MSAAKALKLAGQCLIAQALLPQLRQHVDPAPPDICVQADSRRRVRRIAEIEAVAQAVGALLQFAQILRVPVWQNRPRLLAPLPGHVRRHVDSGAVLGLQRAVLAEDEIDEASREILEALQRLGASEILRDEEVDVAVLGVAEDDCVRIAVLIEQHLQIGADPAEGFHRNRDVLEQGSRSLRPVACDLRVEALAHDPHVGATGGVAGELRSIGEACEVAEQLVRGFDPLHDAVVVEGFVFDEQRRVTVRDEALRQHDCAFLAHGPHRRGIDQLDDVCAGVDDVRQRCGG